MMQPVKKLTHLYTAYSCVMLKAGNVYYLGMGSKQCALERASFNIMATLLHYCCSPKTVTQVQEFCQQRGIPWQTVENARQHGWLLLQQGNHSPTTDRQLIFYHLLGYDALNLQTVLQRHSIWVVGCGGIGTAMAYALSGMGVGHLRLIDHDHVSKSNLNRQFLYTTQDIGRPKAWVLAEALRARFSGTRISSCVQSFKDSSQFTAQWSLDRADLIIYAADEQSCLSELNDFATRQRAPLLPVGYLNDLACVGNFVIPQRGTASLLCHDIHGGFEEAQTSVQESMHCMAQRYIAPSVVPNNFFAAAMAVMEVIKFCAGDHAHLKTVDRRVVIDVNRFTQHELVVSRRPSCVHCGE
jgi:hypothetical protein